MSNPTDYPTRTQVAKQKLRTAVRRLCPHAYTETSPYTPGLDWDIQKRERCRICGKTRIHARLPEPHPARDRSELVEALQGPDMEVVVVEWLPYESTEAT